MRRVAVLVHAGGCPVSFLESQTMNNMNRMTLVAALVALTLAGCTSVRGGTELVRSDVTFDGGKIGLKSPVVLVSANPGGAIVEWQLPAGKDVTFPENGIVIEGSVVFPSETVPESKGQPPNEAGSLRVDARQKSNFTCVLREDRLKIACSSKTLVPGVYKYTIRVVRKDGQVLKVDPPMVIM
ncbi:MAG: hypothetical protein AD742_17055 [Methylibium sp. NZG]|nr:MAG: hypothetical protein AD742_17055 [Methylibium sp. NZG]